MERTGDEQAHTMDYWLIEDELEVHLILNKWKITKKNSPRDELFLFLYIYMHACDTQDETIFLQYFYCYLLTIYICFFSSIL